MAVQVNFSGVRPTELAKRITKTVRKDLPKDVKTAGLRHFSESFRKGGFTDISFQPWKPRKNNTKSKGRGILIKSSRLRRSLSAVTRTDGVTFLSRGVPYAEIHNEGGTINHPGGTPYFVKGGKAVFVKKETASRYAAMYKKVMKVTGPHSITIPQRKFMGRSATLLADVKSIIIKHLNNI